MDKKYDMFTLFKEVQIKASGGAAMILNPVNMTVLQNDVAADKWVDLPAVTQVILSGMYNNDVYLLVVAMTGDFNSEEHTYGLVVRRASWQKLTDAAMASKEEEEEEDIY